MGFELFEDQAEFVINLRKSIASGKRSVLGVASPAFGKTVVAAHITESVRQKNENASVWFLVHRKNLLRQTSNSFWQAKIEHGLMTSGRMRTNSRIQIGTIGTVHSRLETLKPPAVLFIDEAHLSKGNMFSNVIEWAINHGAIVIGLTGTPERLDGKSLGDLYQDLIEAKPTSWLIEQGRLSNYVAYTVPNMPDVSQVHKSQGDYNREELANVMDKPTITGDAVAHWRRYANGMRTVVYCVNVKHSEHTAQYFNDSGIPAVHVDANTTESELKDACEGLATGRYKVLCNCELVIEGFDLSAQVGMDVTLECCILLRPTQSLARYLQMVFRALRKKDRPAVILDHAGCIMKHGLPCDDRQWSLEGRTKGKRKKADDEPALNVQQCGKCYGVFRSGVDECPYCHAPVEKKERVIREQEGELAQVDIEAIKRERKREQGSSRTLHDLVSLGMRKGMKRPDAWAANVIAAREKRKPGKDDFNNARETLRSIRSEQGNNSAASNNDSLI